MTAKQGEHVTAVIIAYQKNRLNTRLIFGTPRVEIRRGWHRKLALFYPGDVFGYERWRGDKYGTQGWTFSVCAAASNGTVTRICGVVPGAKLLLRVSGKAKVKRALTALDALKLENPRLEKLPETRWRELHHALATGQTAAQISAQLQAEVSC